MVVTRFIRGWIWLFLVAALITGCGTVGKWFKDPTLVEATFKVSNKVNRDEYGNSRAIWARVYLLKSTGAFEGAEFFNLKEHDQDILARDLISWERFWFNPGEEVLHKLSASHEESPEDSLYVAIMAGYRDLGNARWRTTIEIPSRKKSKINVFLDELAVRIELED